MAWPTSVATDAELHVAKNLLSTTLNGGIDAVTTTVVLTDASQFPTAGFVTIDSEVIRYTGKTVNTLTGVVRGADGTTAAVHVNNAQVYHHVVAAHHNDLKNEIIAIESSLNLASSRAVQTDGTGRVTAALVTSTELGHVGGVTSAIQTQLNGKEPTITVLPISKGGTNSGAALVNDRVMRSSSGAITESTITETQLTRLPNLFAYRRPVLQYVNATTVDVESGLVTGTSGDVTIVFPDGQLRTVNSTTKTRFDITRNAVLSGTTQSGLRTGTEANDTWYALYAVKVTDNATDFVTVGDTVLPLRANFSTLNTNFGTNSWVYLGLIRNGNGSGTPGDIVLFTMSAGRTFFRNSATGSVRGVIGVRLATQAVAAASLTYTHVAGTGNAQIPDNILIGGYSGNAGNVGIDVLDSTAAIPIAYVGGDGVNGVTYRTEIPVVLGFRLQSSGANTTYDIGLWSFTDSVLTTGYNPVV